jgi:hypothetical protein
MILKRQGYYREMPHGDDTDPSIFERLHNEDDNKDKICKYLREGYVLAACGNFVKDVVCPEKGIVGAPDDITDGVWIWPADLVYYVENYGLLLDDVFVKYMSEHAWTVPKNLEIDEDNIEVIN